MFDPYLSEDASATPIELIRTDRFDGWLADQTEQARLVAARQGFKAEPGQHCWLPNRPSGSASGNSAANAQRRPEDSRDESARVAVGWDGQSNLSTLGGLPLALGEGVYRLSSATDELQLLGWGLGCYQFSRYKHPQRSPARLVLPEGLRPERLANLVNAVTLARDLINTPAGDLGPTQLAEEAMQVADAHNAACRVLIGNDLLGEGFGAIHAVGRAAADPPRLVDVRWGEAGHPLVVVVGKGVCFDSGGLDIKPASGMRTMKKDMGGAAAALGLAQLIMAEQLPVRLRLLIPAVENAIAGNAYRPGDILQTYAGISVEVDNTDAEGRLILCDALALAAEERPECMVDFATLTGAARVAVGTEIAALFCNDDALAEGIARAGKIVDDPVWPLPLHESYNHLLESKVADTLNSANSPYAGAITAALFLQKFVGEIPWAHFDIMAYNLRKRPARPEGGEAMAMRAVFYYLEQRFRP